jgi:sugar phosphate permease
MTDESRAPIDGQGPASGGAEPPALPLARAYLLLATLAVGYVGVYLCRKNFAVAIPLVAADLGVSRAQVGAVAGWSTLAYAVGKFLFGPVIDRFGGRRCFLLSLLGVVVFGGSGAFASGLLGLGLAYGANRFAGSLAWGAMVKMVPTWFTARRLPLAMAWLSLSIVFGGAAATLTAGQIAEWSGNNWRAVMGVPALVLLALLVFNWRVLPTAPPAPTASVPGRDAAGFHLNQLPQLFATRKFWVVLGLSFSLYLMREVFNTWTVDFFKTEGGAALSNRIAAFLATPFDVLGALGILVLGWLFGRFGPAGRTRLLFAMLVLLTASIYALPHSFRWGLWLPTVAVGLIGFLSYGPYSLLAGILSVEIRGKDYVATVAGMVDGVGYVAGYLAGATFGRLVDAGGYRLGFESLAAVTLVAAFLSLFLYRRGAEPDEGLNPDIVRS